MGLSQREVESINARVGRALRQDRDEARLAALNREKLVWTDDESDGMRARRRKEGEPLREGDDASEDHHLHHQAPFCFVAPQTPNEL